MISSKKDQIVDYFDDFGEFVFFTKNQILPNIDQKGTAVIPMERFFKKNGLYVHLRWGW